MLNPDVRKKSRDNLVKYIQNNINDINEKRSRTLIEKYGSVENSYINRSLKAQETKYQRYGDINYNNVEKIKQTKQEKYGDPNYNNKSLAKNTCMSLYGGIGMSSPLLREKTVDTMISRYGVTTNFLSSDPKLNGIEGKITRFGSIQKMYEYTHQKTCETKFNRYGDMHYRNPEKARKTFRIKYNADSYLSSEDFKSKRPSYAKENLEKSMQTKRRRNTFNKSSLEDEYMKRLMLDYESDDIHRQYKDYRYPFYCDFYIKTEDIFIECNFSWVHGPHPFNKSCEEDIVTLQKWQEKATTSKYYQTAIYVWTDLDVRKLNTARSNNLNFKMIYIDEKGNYNEYR